MDQLDRVSVIIPVYNVEKYIDECFQSLLSQDTENWEAIIVDDGSTDTSGKICDSYQKKDKRFHVFHTDNRGIAAARNLAMEHMTGRYCFFLDPDDVIEADSLSYLAKLLEKTKTDMALAVTRQFQGEYVAANHPPPVETVHEGHTDIIEHVLLDKNDLKPLARKREAMAVAYEFFSTMYRTAQLTEHDIRFLPISYAEDTYVCFQSLLTSGRVVTSSKIVYSHRRNPTSTTFQYHPLYLEETKKYYDFYLGLFEKYAPGYIDQVKEGLDAQYLRRCLSAVERELFLSPKSRKLSEKISTIRQINADGKFRKMFTFSNLKYTSPGVMRWVLVSMKLGVYPVAVAVINGARKK